MARLASWATKSFTGKKRSLRAASREHTNARLVEVVISSTRGTSPPVLPPQMVAKSSQAVSGAAKPGDWAVQSPGSMPTVFRGGASQRHAL